MMEPPPRPRIERIAARDQRKLPVRLVLSTPSHSESAVSGTLVRFDQPAQARRTSNPPEPLGDRLGVALHRRLVPDVAFEEKRRLSGALAVRIRELGDVPIHDHELRPLAGEEAQARKPDPRPSAGDHRDLSSQSSVHLGVLFASDLLDCNP